MQFIKDCNVAPREVIEQVNHASGPSRSPWLTASFCSGAISAKVSMSVGGSIPCIIFDKCEYSFYIQSYGSPLISWQRYRGGAAFRNGFKKWVRSNESLLNIKNKMASLSSIFPVGAGYNAGAAGLSREARKLMFWPEPLVKSVALKRNR